MLRYAATRSIFTSSYFLKAATEANGKIDYTLLTVCVFPRAYLLPAYRRGLELLSPLFYSNAGFGFIGPQHLDLVWLHQLR